MPLNKNAYIRYQALDRCFKNSGRDYHIDDLVKSCNKALEAFNGGASSVRKRQVYDDIRYMKSIEGYSAPIESYRKGRRKYYRYEDRHFSINNQPLNEAETQKIQSVLGVFQRFRGLPQFEWLQEILPKLQEVFGLRKPTAPIFQFEQNIYLKGLEYLEILYQHIIKEEVLEVTFRDFGQPAVVYTLHPYLLKQYNKRWFLVSQNHDNQRIWVTALDRIEDIQAVNGVAYRENTIDLEEYFDDILGVTKYKDEALQVIRLKVYQGSMAYVKTKPIHPSQKRVEETEEYMVIELQLMLNYELESLILSYGDNMEVLAPSAFREKIAARIQRVKGFYD